MRGLGRNGLYKHLDAQWTSPSPLFWTSDNMNIFYPTILFIPIPKSKKIFPRNGVICLALIARWFSDEHLAHVDEKNNEHNVGSFKNMEARKSDFFCGRMWALTNFISSKNFHLKQSIRVLDFGACVDGGLEDMEANGTPNITGCRGSTGLNFW